MKYNFTINKIAEDVYEIENFLDELELYKFKSIIDNANEMQWHDKNYIPNEESFWYGKSLFLGESHELSKIAIFDKVDFIFPSYFYCEKENLPIYRWLQISRLNHRGQNRKPLRPNLFHQYRHS